MNTAPGVCVLGWVKCREQHFTAGYTLYNYVCMYKKNKNKKNKNRYFFFTKPIMVKYLNIGKNIGKPIYRSISRFEQCQCGRAGSALYSLGVSFLTRQ